MFENLTENLNKIFDRLKNRGVISESQIEETMREIRVALLEADVALPVVRSLIDAIKIKALGQEVIKSISPAQMIIKIIHDEIVEMLSAEPENLKLNLNAQPPVSLLIVGLQGSGKTTASAKLALKLAAQNKKVLLVSLDIYRPAAQEQLEILAETAGVNSLDIISGQLPSEITNRAIKEAKLCSYDVVIYDTAGRLDIDEAMLSEVKEIKALTKPTETLLVVDAMIGQEAINIAHNFNETLDISGVILSRIDGDTRGGAALSIKYVIGKPIKFLSTGEKLASLEEFQAERIASRILDKGDIVALVEQAQSAFDQDEMEKAARRMQKGLFDLNDYMAKIRGIKKMGGIAGVMKMIPGIGKIASAVQQDSRFNEQVLKRQEAIILSMTQKERRNPDLLNASRRKRIADGAGVSIQQVNILLKQFKQMSIIVKKTSKMDPKALMRGGLNNLFS